MGSGEYMQTTARVQSCLVWETGHLDGVSQQALAVILAVLEKQKRGAAYLSALVSLGACMPAGAASL